MRFGFITHISTSLTLLLCLSLHEFIVQFQLYFLLYNCITSEVGTIQGEVEQISLMKPKAQSPHDEGFLEYLEDIIGTNQYVEKIEEAYKQ